MGKMEVYLYMPCWLWRHGFWCLLSLLGCLLFFALVCVLFSFIGLVPAFFSRRCLRSYGVTLILLKGDTAVFDPMLGSLGSLLCFGLSDWVSLDTELLVSLPPEFFSDNFNVTDNIKFLASSPIRSSVHTSTDFRRNLPYLSEMPMHVSPATVSGRQSRCC